MQPLIDLGTRISEYNLIGSRKLPMIKLAIIQAPQHHDIIQNILKELEC
jgi:hypothetical protein